MLNIEQENAMIYIKSGHNVYIGWVAGTGMSYMVKAIIECAHNTGKQLVLTCTMHAFIYSNYK
jgi:hypothetical protein